MSAEAEHLSCVRPHWLLEIARRWQQAPQGFFDLCPWFFPQEIKQRHFNLLLLNLLSGKKKSRAV